MTRQNSRHMPYLVFLVSFVFLLSSICCAIVKKGDDSEPIQATAPTIPPSLKIESLQLANNTRRRTTRGPLSEESMPTTPSPHAISNDNEGVLYRLDSRDGSACILIYTDGIVHIGFKTGLKEERSADVYMPDKVESSGVCDEDSSKFTITWGNFAWTVYFSKTPGGDHWFVEKMTLDANTDDKHLEHINRGPSSTLHFVQPKDSGMMFPTPVGKAYECKEEISIELEDGDATANIILRSLVMQPFIFKNSQFGPRHICSPGGAKAYRDETAPVAVGSTFAVVTILTVVGYGVYRYMKVKKVQYDTME